MDWGKMSSEVISQWTANAGVLALGATLVAGAGLFILAMVKSCSASVRATIAVVTLIGVLILPLVSLLPLGIKMPVLRATWQSTIDPKTGVPFNYPDAELMPPMKTEIFETAQRTVTCFTTIDREARHNVRNSAAEPPTAGVQIKIILRKYGWLALVVVWGVGAVVRILGLLFSIAGLSWVRRGAREVSQGLLLIWDSVRKGSATRVQLLLSDRLQVPVTWGLLRPVIFLPDDFGNWKPEAQQAALSHELAHVRRCDFLALIFGQLTLGLYWWNPLVWKLLSRWKSEAEKACDDRVLGEGVANRAYGTLLVEVLERVERKSRLVSSLGLAMIRRTTVEERLASILDGTRNRGLISPVGFAGVAMLVLLVASVLGSVKPVPAPYQEKHAPFLWPLANLTPRQESHILGIIRQCQGQERLSGVLSLEVEYVQKQWDEKKKSFIENQKPSLASVLLDFTIRPMRYRVEYHPQVVLWTSGTLVERSRYEEHSRVEISDGEQTWSNDNPRYGGWSHRLEPGDIGYMTATRYCADTQAHFAALEFRRPNPNANNGDMTTTCSMGEETLNGATVVRLQRDLKHDNQIGRDEWWFDPAKDYALVQYRSQGMNLKKNTNSISLVKILGLAEIAPHVWYPVHYVSEFSKEENGVWRGDFMAEGQMKKIEMMQSVSSDLFCDPTLKK